MQNYKLPRFNQLQTKSNFGNLSVSIQYLLQANLAKERRPLSRETVLP